MRDRRSVAGVLFGAGLIPEDAECQQRGPDGAVPGDDRVDDVTVRPQIISVETQGVYGGGPSLLENRDLIVEIIGSAGRQDHGGTGRKTPRYLQPDLAAPTEDHEKLAHRA